MMSDAPSFKTHHREKLINAAIYFISGTTHCHTLKLFKLLYFLDFEHFRQTAFSVTGLVYKAWPNGPAPSELWHEMKAPKRDLAEAISINPVKEDFTDKTLRRDLKPRKSFDASWFTRREAKIMERLVFVFRDAIGVDMTGITHARHQPWAEVYKGGKGKGEIIPYELALTSEPVIKDMPSLTDEEYRYRRDVFAGID
jgi:uncharacterized phage-associated protein